MAAARSSSSSATAGLFLATILLLAATSALAQAPAPSSVCPLGLDKVPGGTLPSVQLGEIASQLLALGLGTATKCVCNVAGSTVNAQSILNTLGLGLLGLSVNCSNA